MAKKIETTIKLQIPAGNANPAPPVGPALGQHGLNIMEFCKAFNAKTQSLGGILTPVIITVYTDKTFLFETKTPPASTLLNKAISVPKRSGETDREKVGVVTQKQLREIAELKMVDLNASSVENAMLMIAGTARSMGIDVDSTQ